VSADGRTLLLQRSLSNREDKLFTLDIASGRLTEIATGTPANLSGARFVRGGAAVLAISNRGSDVQRLVEIDVASGQATPVSPSMAWNVEGSTSATTDACWPIRSMRTAMSRSCAGFPHPPRAARSRTFPKG
jgi:hypothetical protein